MLRREREQALLVEKSKQEEKERRKLEQQLAKEAKEAKKKTSKEKKVRHTIFDCFYDNKLFIRFFLF